jgi:hypothetical protein
LSPPKEELDSRLRGNDENQKEGSTREAFGETMHSRQHCVIPAKAGIQLFSKQELDSRVRGSDEEMSGSDENKKEGSERGAFQPMR